MKGRKVCIKTRSPSASLSFKDQVTKHTTVKWTIVPCDMTLIKAWHELVARRAAHVVGYSQEQTLYRVNRDNPFTPKSAKHQILRKIPNFIL